MAVAKIRTGVSIGFNCGTITVFRKSATSLCGVHRVSSTVFLLLERQDPAISPMNSDNKFHPERSFSRVTNSETCQDISRYQMISNKPSNEPFIPPWRPSNNPSLVRSVPLHSQPRSSTLTPNHRFEELNAKIAAEFTLNRLSKMIKGKESVAVSKVKVVVSWAANLSADQNRPKLCCYVLLWDINDSCQTLAIFGLAIVDEQCRMNNKKMPF